MGLVKYQYPDEAIAYNSCFTMSVDRYGPFDAGTNGGSAPDVSLLTASCRAA